MRRTDWQIDFAWGQKSPLPTQTDEFSVRWTGEVEAPVTGDYTFATKANLNSATLPRNRYSHSDQTQQWQTANPTVAGGSGWGGRMADLLAGRNASTFPMGVSVNGSAAPLQGATSRPISLSPGTALGLQRFGNATAMNAREAGLQQRLTFDTGMQMIGAASGVMASAVRGAQEINAALGAGTPLTTVFPQTGLGRQLQRVATVMRVRQALGMNRQIFFCGMGGFDNHSDQLPSHDNLLGQLDAAIGAFYTSLEQDLQLANETTLFTENEFGRTGNPSSSNGSDHAWGCHHFMFGGSVKGGRGIRDDSDARAPRAGRRGKPGIVDSVDWFRPIRGYDGRVVRTGQRGPEHGVS